MKPYLAILKLAWPLALGMLNNALMQLVDRAFLARESMASLEAALPASMLAFIFLGFFQSVIAYSGTFVAQYHGAGDGRKAHLSYRAGLLLALVAGVLMLPLVPLGDWILSLAAHSPDVLVRERIYYTIVMVGGVGLFGQMAAQAYFTGIGKTRIVFWVNVLGNLVNIILDPVLIFGWWVFPKWGIAGAAVATVFATFVQWAVLGVAVARCRNEVVSWRDSRGELFDLMKRILRFGVPSGGYSILNMLSFTIFVFMTGRVSDVAFAVSNACFSVCYFLFAPMEGFSLAASTLVGQAQGCGDTAAARLAGSRTVKLAVSLVAVASLVTLLLWRPILSLFAPEAAVAAEFYELGFILVLLMSAWQVFDAADVVLSGALKGAGDTRFVLVWMLVVAFGLWMPLVWVVSVCHNTMPALWATMILYVAVMFIGSLIRWRRGRWSSIKLV